MARAYLHCAVYMKVDAVIPHLYYEIFGLSLTFLGLMSSVEMQIMMVQQLVVAERENFSDLRNI